MDYTGKMQLGSDDPRALLPAAATFTLPDAGMRTVTPVMLNTAGLRTVEAHDTTYGHIQGQQPNILVSALSAPSLVLALQHMWLAV